MQARTLRLDKKLFVVVALVVIAVTTVTSNNANAESTRRALIVGINEYKAKVIPDLRGAVNDTVVTQQVLVSRFGFLPENITVLLDSDATRAAVLNALRKAVAATDEDDVLYFHYSGHGSQVRDLNGDETDDGKDETIVPHDSRTGGITDIVDDELNSILAGLRNTETFVVLDSCHSGTATRSHVIVPRSIDEDKRVDMYRKWTTLTKKPALPSLTAGGASAKVGTREINMSPHRYVMMTGASSRDSALDGPIGGQYRGFFTHALTQVLGELGPDASPDAMHQGVKQLYLTMQEEYGGLVLPEPQLEAPQAAIANVLFPTIAGLLNPAAQPENTGPQKAPVLLPAARHYLTAQPAGMRSVRIIDGAIHGATPGTEMAIYGPQETRFIPGTAYATVRIDELDGRHALGVANPDGTTIQTNSRAIQISATPPNDAVTVEFRTEPGLRNALQNALRARLPGIQFAEPRQFARFIVETAAATCSGCPEDIVVFGAAGLSEVDRFPLGAPDEVAQRLAQRFSRSLNASAIKSLVNPGSRIELDVRIVTINETRKISLVPSYETAAYRIRRSGEPRSHQNSLMLEITANCDCYVTVVDLDPNGDIGILFPNPYSERSGFYRDGLVRRGVPVRIPDSLQDANSAGFHFDYSPPIGVDTLQVFAATDFASAEKLRKFIEQAAADVSTRGSAQASITEAISDLAQASAYRGVQVVPNAKLNGPSKTQMSPVADWTSVALAIRLSD